MKYLVVLGVFLLSLVANVRAADPSAFVVTIIPDTFRVGEAVDMEIRAVDADGTVVTDYEGDVFLNIEELGALSQDMYSLPGNDFYSFVPQDQGVKTFSKGLIIREEGSFTVAAQDILDGSIQGEATAIVIGNDEDNTATAIVTINSPLESTILDRETATIVGTSDSPRTPVFVDVNGTLLDTGLTTDQSGAFSIPIDGLNQGSNQVTIQLRDAQGEVLGDASVSFEVVVDTAELFESLTLNPDGDVMSGDIVDVVANVADRATSVALVVDGSSVVPLDEIDTGRRGAPLTFGDAGEYTMLIRVQAGDERVEQELDSLTILAPEIEEENEPSPIANTGSTIVKLGIGQISYMVDELESGTAIIQRIPDGSPSDYYIMAYGIDPTELDNTMITTTTGVTLTGLSLDESTYVQVWPSDSEGQITGTPSDPLVIQFGPLEPICVVQGIELSTERRGDAYFLVWDDVDGASEYVVLRADLLVSDISTMTEIARTSISEYRYPFDIEAEADQYAYYAVQALCEGLAPQLVGSIEKVQVGPVSSALLILMIVGGVYLLFKVNHLYD